MRFWYESYVFWYESYVGSWQHLAVVDERRHGTRDGREGCQDVLCHAFVVLLQHYPFDRGLLRFGERAYEYTPIPLFHPNVWNIPISLPSPQRLGLLSSEYGTMKTVQARFWSWLSGKSPEHLSCGFQAKVLNTCQSLLGSGRGYADFRYHSTPGLTVMKKKKRERV